MFELYHQSEIPLETEWLILFQNFGFETCFSPKPRVLGLFSLYFETKLRSFVSDGRDHLIF